MSSGRQWQSWDPDFWDFQDLLDRKPEPSRDPLPRETLEGKSVLVTGAGGSIGAELCRLAAGFGPSRLILLDMNEFGLYRVEGLLNDPGHRVPILPVLGTVSDGRLLAKLLAEEHVQTIYHAAAYKHVPLVERNPVAGVRNNIFATKLLAEAAREAGVEALTFISTDKAVRPTSVMGATKRVAEMVLQDLALEEGGTRFSMVRFGNVLGSSGSVVPLFQEQIRTGGPVTVTHPEATRYFMTLTEAAQLVFQAGSLANGGDLFALDMGAPIKILDLAERMIRRAGLIPRDPQTREGDIAIQFTGLRPGEKLNESPPFEADSEPTPHPRIRRVRERLPSPGQIAALLGTLESQVHARDTEGLRQTLAAAVRPFGARPS